MTYLINLLNLSAFSCSIIYLKNYYGKITSLQFLMYFLLIILSKQATYLGYLAILLTIAIIDQAEFIIPNELSLALLFISLPSNLIFSLENITYLHFISALIFILLTYFSLGLKVIGFGDVKLLFVLFLVLEQKLFLQFTLVLSVLSFLNALIYLNFAKNLKSKFPLGPVMFLACLLTLGGY